MHPHSNSGKTSCDRCGSCCLQGGPALHGGDLHLIRAGSLAIGDLVTIRKGELAYQPMADTPSLVDAEFLKIGGKPGSWACRFYDEPGRACTIYGNRPLACGLFDCTAPEAVLGITGQDLLTRFSCAEHDEPLVSIAREHEGQYPCPDLAGILSRLQDGGQRKNVLARLTPLVNDELTFRCQVAKQRQLSIGEELFWFGRPLFQLLQPLGIQVQETVSGLHLA
jgi:Fe-S-cluster containining protein